MLKSDLIAADSSDVHEETTFRGVPRLATHENAKQLIVGTEGIAGWLLRSFNRGSAARCALASGRHSYDGNTR
jgi:hypothetical protein